MRTTSCRGRNARSASRSTSSAGTRRRGSSTSASRTCCRRRPRHAWSSTSAAARPSSSSAAAWMPERLESLKLGCVGVSQRFFPEGELTRRRVQGGRNACALGDRGDREPVRSCPLARSVRIIGDGAGARRDPREQRLVVRRHHAGGARAAAAQDDQRRARVEAHAGRAEAGPRAGARRRLRRDERRAGRASRRADQSGRRRAAGSACSTTCSAARSIATAASRRSSDSWIATASIASTRSASLRPRRRSTCGRRRPDEDAAQRVEWAGWLHEVGLTVSHIGFHKHSAYILQHADMPGFSAGEQRDIARLALGCRGGLDKVAGVLDDHGPARANPRAAARGAVPSRASPDRNAAHCARGQRDDPPPCAAELAQGASADRASDREGARGVGRGRLPVKGAAVIPRLRAAASRGDRSPPAPRETASRNRLDRSSSPKQRVGSARGSISTSSPPTRSRAPRAESPRRQPSIGATIGTPPSVAEPSPRREPVRRSNDGCRSARRRAHTGRVRGPAGVPASRIATSNSGPAIAPGTTSMVRSGGAVVRSIDATARRRRAGSRSSPPATAPMPRPAHDQVVAATARLRSSTAGMLRTLAQKTADTPDSSAAPAYHASVNAIPRRGQGGSTASISTTAKPSRCSRWATALPISSHPSTIATSARFGSTQHFRVLPQGKPQR